jgi:uncharacterized protein (DUF362 family)
MAQAADAPPKAAGGKSRVVLVEDARAATDAGINESAIREMLDKGITALTGQSDAKAAWASLFKPDDVVGVKVNCLFGIGVSTHPEVTAAVVEGIKSAGVPDGKIVIYDREDGHLRSVGYEVNRGAGVRCQGTDWTEKTYGAGVFKGRLSTILTDEITALANMPCLKHHSTSGVSISMKNHYGSIDNPGACHDNNCNPAIADVCTLSPIKDKTRVIICDALVPQCDGGPGRNAAAAWTYGGLLLSRDMVALDYQGWQIIEARRKETGLGSLAGQVGHIASAAQRGLGTNDPNQIELVEI